MSAAVAEVWLILSVLSGGQTSLADAFVLESTGRLITVVFKVVPFRHRRRRSRRGASSPARSASR